MFMLNSGIRGWLPFVLCCAALPAQAAQWLPVTAEDLTMTEEPQAPKAPAIILYRQVDRDDSASVEHDYVRLKILTEEGRQYANVEIPYGGREWIRDIEARTIRPDGSIRDFNGTIYDTKVADGEGANLHAKTFALPDVPVGSVIEYRYTQDLAYGYVFNSRWILSQNLFTKEAKFSLRPYRRLTLRWSWPSGLPAGTNPPRNLNEVISLETHDVPAFVKEPFMPPQNELMYRVDFIYVAAEEDETDPLRFWSKLGKARFRRVEDFVNARRAMVQAVTQIIAPDDPPEVKLRKIYERTQRLRNITFAPRLTEQEKDREQREPKDVAEVWQHDYGNSQQINWLFLALVRAAGVEADPVLVANRDASFFDARLMNPGQLNATAVRVLVNGKELFFDPAAEFAPFGMLPWGLTGVRGLLLDKDGGRWVEMPMPAPSDSRLEHKAEFRLSASGTLTGRVIITATGLEARACRLHERNEDAIHRKLYLETLVKMDVPSPIEVTVATDPDWDNPAVPFVAEYAVTIPDWATVTGQRALLPVAVFSGRWRHAFEHAVRVHPIYFHFPFESSDEVRVELPAEWHVESLPPARNTDLHVLIYRAAATDTGAALQLSRSFTSKATLVDSKYYDSLRGFFQSVRSGDAEQLVLTAATPSAGLR